MKEPIPSIEWIITEKCNYNCSYCFQRKYNERGINEGHCSDAVINAVIRLLPNLPGRG